MPLLCRYIADKARTESIKDVLSNYIGAKNIIAFQFGVWKRCFYLYDHLCIVKTLRHI